MPDQQRAALLAREGFTLWQSDRLEEAVECYRAALAIADPSQDGLADYHGELAGVLATLGRHAEAREQYEFALDCECRVDPDGPGVSVLRYLLAELLLTMGEPAGALDALLPGLNSVSDQEWLLRLVQADALWQLGQKSQAQVAARLAFQLAPEANRDDLRERVGRILSEGSA